MGVLNSIQEPVWAKVYMVLFILLQLTVMEVDPFEARMRYSSPDALPAKEALINLFPHRAVGGTCSVRWSQ